MERQGEKVDGDTQHLVDLGGEQHHDNLGGDQDHDNLGGDQHHDNLGGDQHHDNLGGDQHLREGDVGDQKDGGGKQVGGQTSDFWK